MRKPVKSTGARPGAELPPEPDEVGPAVRDVGYELAHDLSDSLENLRDAAALAPLAAAKLAQRWGAFLAARPKRMLLALAGLGLLAGVALTRRRRPPN